MFTGFSWTELYELTWEQLIHWFNKGLAHQAEYVIPLRYKADPEPVFEYLKCENGVRAEVGKLGSGEVRDDKQAELRAKMAWMKQEAEKGIVLDDKTRNIISEMKKMVER